MIFNQNLPIVANAPIWPTSSGSSSITLLAEDNFCSTSYMDQDRKRLLEDVERIVRAAVQDEAQRHHVWSFSKRSRNHRELLGIGQVVQGSALRELDQAEHVIQIVDFLKDRIAQATWAQHNRKFENIYTIELKHMKLRECREEGAPPPVTFNQGEHRIVYTDADMELIPGHLF